MTSPSTYAPAGPPAAPYPPPAARPRGPLDAWLVPLLAPMVGGSVGLFVGLFLEGDNIPLTRSFLGSLRILWDLLVWLGAGEALAHGLVEGNADQLAALTGVLYLVAMGALLAAVILLVPVVNLMVVTAGVFQLLGLAYGATRTLATDARRRGGGWTLLLALGGSAVLWLALGAVLLLFYSPGATAAFCAITSPVPLGLSLMLASGWLLVRAILFPRFAR